MEFLERSKKFLDAILSFFCGLIKQNQGLSKGMRYVKNHIDSTLPAHMIMPQTILVFDALMAFLSFFVALYLRIGEEFLDYSPAFVLKNMAVFAIVSASIFIWMQTHRAVWRYVSIEDMLPLSLSAVLANIIFFPLMLLMAQQESIPRSVPLINAFVFICFLGLPRFIHRYAYDCQVMQKRRLNIMASVPVLLIGPSDAGESFISEAFHSPDLPYNPVGLITFEDEEAGCSIHGVPVLGALDDLGTIMMMFGHEIEAPKQIIIVGEKVPAKLKSRIIDYATAEGLPLMHMLHHFSIDTVES
ncbi:MAG: hypothetical protein NTX76_05830 [Alphaproteobacteria bacterium]|nr:hypothetical protein [Alphaproteobacteria bacterium]